MRPMRILVAEDNAVNQKLAVAMLTKIGCRAEVAANGLEVFEPLRRQQFDLVLMDVLMPGCTDWPRSRYAARRARSLLRSIRPSASSVAPAYTAWWNASMPSCFFGHSVGGGAI